MLHQETIPEKYNNLAGQDILCKSKRSCKNTTSPKAGDYLTLPIYKQTKTEMVEKRKYR